MKATQLGIVIALLASLRLAVAQGTTFNYQGRLNDGDVPATGVYDLQFGLWNAAVGGIQIGGTVLVNDLAIANGLFTASLDFGGLAFDGSARWLQIAVRPGASGGEYAPLATRTQVLPSPYAIYASKAATATTASAASAVPWSGITGVPAGFSDGVDNDTLYTAGTGISLAGTALSLNTAYTDGRYVDVAGDTMTGTLAVPNLSVSGTLTNHAIDCTTKVLSIRSVSDIELTIDKNDSAGAIGYFEIFNGAGAHAFYVDEAGNSRSFGDHTVDGKVTANAFSGNGTGLTLAGLVRTTVLDVDCASIAAYGTTFTKVANIASFTKALAGSTIEVTFNGRLYVEAMAAGATGARFELRVDDAATTNGRARASLRKAEVGGGGIPTSITGIFTGLGAGVHTVSMWIEGGFGGGTKSVPGSGLLGDGSRGGQGAQVNGTRDRARRPGRGNPQVLEQSLPRKEQSHEYPITASRSGLDGSAAAAVPHRPCSILDRLVHR